MHLSNMLLPHRTADEAREAATERTAKRQVCACVHRMGVRGDSDGGENAVQAKEEKRLKKVRRQQKRDELRRQGLVCMLCTARSMPRVTAHTFVAFFLQPMSMASDLSDTDEDEGEYEGSGTEDDHDDDPSDGEGKAARPSKRMATSTARYGLSQLASSMPAFTQPLDTVQHARSGYETLTGKSKRGPSASIALRRAPD